MALDLKLKILKIVTRGEVNHIYVIDPTDLDKIDLFRFEAKAGTVNRSFVHTIMHVLPKDLRERGKYNKFVKLALKPEAKLTRDEQLKLYADVRAFYRPFVPEDELKILIGDDYE